MHIVDLNAAEKDKSDWDDGLFSEEMSSKMKTEQIVKKSYFNFSIWSMIKKIIKYGAFTVLGGFMSSVLFCMFYLVYHGKMSGKNFKRFLERLISGEDSIDPEKFGKFNKMSKKSRPRGFAGLGK